MKKVLLSLLTLVCMGLSIVQAQYTPIFGSYLQFTGANSNYINCSNNTAIQLTGSYTLEAWVNPSAAADMSIIEKYSAPCQGGYVLRMNSARKIVALTLGSPNVCNALTSASSIPLNQWSHVATTYNAGTLRIFINGALDATLTGQPNPNTSTNFLAIGRRGDNSAALYYSGLIDEVRIWNTERSALQIAIAKNGPLAGNEANLVAYYNFNQSGQGNGLPLINTSTSAQSGGAAINGITFGNSSTPSFMTQSNSLDFDGINDVITIPQTSLLNPSNALTLEAYVFLNNTSHQAIIHNWAPNNQFTLEIFQNTLGFVLNTTTGVLHLASPTPIPTNQWVHVAGVYDGITMKVYENGVLKNSVAKTGNIISNGNNGAIHIGNRDDGGNGPLNGRIDDIRIWNIALTASQLATYTCVPTSATNLLANYHFNQGIASANNAGITTLTDASGFNNTGTLSGFALINSLSNWVNSGVLTTACTPCMNTTGSSAVGACSSYVWNNTTYTSTGTYTASFTSAGGCDSVHTLNLTIYPSCTASALAFNGNSQVNCGNTLGNFGTGSFTVETWLEVVNIVSIRFMGYCIH